MANEGTTSGEAATTTVTPDAPTIPPNVPAPSLPCPYRQSALLQQALSPDKMRVAFLLGAGCPTSIRVQRGENEEPLIPDICGLTEKIRTTASASAPHKQPFNQILKLLGDSATNKKTLEDVLTRVRGLVEVLGDRPFEGVSRDVLIALDKFVCEDISRLMSVRLPDRSTPYHQLAAWVGSIPRAHPVEIFTSNYDLLMEQALEECSVPYFDGFSGSDRTFFDVPSMEQDKLPARWARLWKLHGSINWWRTMDGVVQRRQTGDENASQMIHPSRLKYDESRKMPYLAMHDRLRAFLSRGQSVLVTCGYSFSDEHLNVAILDGLGGNPTAVCFGLVFGNRAAAASAIARVGLRGNLRLLGIDGGVLGTLDLDWHNRLKVDDEFHGLAVCTGTLAKRTDAPPDRCKFLLGDFKALGKFLANEVAVGAQNMGNEDAA